jgi:hypothetical protein
MTDRPDGQGVDTPLTYREVVEILRLVKESARSGSMTLRTGDMVLEVTHAAGPSSPRKRGEDR